MKSSMLKISIVLTVLLCTTVGFAELIAGYTFDVNAADDSGNGHHGTLQTGATIITDAERGSVLDIAGGDGVSLTGTNTADNWLTNALMQSHTVMMWTKFTSWGDAAWLPALFWKGNDYQLSRRNLTTTWRWTARTVVAAYQASYSTPDLADSQWHHVAGVTDTATGVVKIYIDGVEIGSTPITGTLVNSAWLGRIGFDLVGQIDDAMFFDEALGPGTIDGSQAGTINYYRVYGLTSPPSGLWLPSVFSDGMILQQNKPIAIWGKAPPNQSVTVSLDSQQWQTTSNIMGQWSLTVPAQTGGYTSHTLSVTSGSDSESFSDILIGEVWLCSGQSNMDWWLVNTSEINEVLAGPEDPDLRVFTVSKQASDTPIKDPQGQWRPATSQFVGNFSAVAYHFGYYLRNQLNVPVGLVVAAYGGTHIECWTSREMLEQDFPSIVQDWENVYYNPETMSPWEDPDDPHNKLGGLYNGMICPVKPYTIRGYIWYQGESNAQPTFSYWLVGPEEYRTLFPAMIDEWRDDWNDTTLPFIFVQLANYNSPWPGQQWPELRDAQNQALNLSDTGMAVTIDIGDPDNIHPDNKKEVGRRLNLEARKIAYGDDTVPQSPRVVGQQGQRFGNSVQFIFSQTSAGGLGISSGTEVTGFQIAGTNGIFYSAQADITNNKVWVWSPSVPAPAEVRYAWDDDPACNLIDEDSRLPVGTFGASVEKPLADLSGDYYVNIEDLSIFWQQWLTSDFGTDINNDGNVDFGDFTVIAEQWLDNR